MSEVLIKAQIKIIMETVSGIGVVHDRERHSRSLAAYLDMMRTSSGIVNGWTIHRLKTPAVRVVIGIGSNNIERTHIYRIIGIYDLNDADDSETTFQALNEAIFAAFKDNPTINSTALSSDQIDVVSIDWEEYGNQLYHTSELILSVMERV
jgi:hypothetical protein